VVRVVGNDGTRHDIHEHPLGNLIAGLKGVYTSMTIDGASTFLEQYTVCLSERLAGCVADAASGILKPANNEAKKFDEAPHEMKSDTDSTYYNIRRHYLMFSDLSLRATNNILILIIILKCVERFSTMVLMKNLDEFPKSFVNHSQSANEIVNYDDEDLETWEVKAKRWAMGVELKDLTEIKAHACNSICFNTTAVVKKAYRKAIICVHLDKLQQRGASI
ncbi:tRNA/rRNA methyltransferase, SpoU family protein, partial [Tanacetum coccineum]